MELAMCTRKVNQLYILCVAGFLVCTIAGCASQLAHSKPGTETTIILTRHAEKTAFTNDRHQPQSGRFRL